MKGDGEGESEGARKNGGKPNNDIKVTRRAFVKTTAAFGAAVAGIPPYNLTNIGDIFLKEDGELMIYPVIYEFEYEFESIWKIPFERSICIETWGCNWNCRWCPIKFSSLKKANPILIEIDKITDLLLNFYGATSKTVVVIAGGDPLLQKEEVLKLIDSLKTETEYAVILATNGSLIEEDFIEEANDLGLDRFMIYFFSLDDKRHRWYTGYSNEDTINALKLVTERFEGITAVNIPLFKFIDMVTFENTCKFLHEINPNFVIRIFCPLHSKHEHEECWKKGRYKAEEIVLRYFNQMDQIIYFSKQIKNIRYQIEEDEKGRLKLVKSWESKKEKEAKKYG